MDDTLSTVAEIVSTRLSWRAIAATLSGDALAAFPDEAFTAPAVSQRFFGRRHLIFNHPEAIRRVLIENAGNYVRSNPALRVLRPIFGRGLFLATGEEWQRQRHTLAPAFAPRAVAILARQVVLCGDALVGRLAATAGAPVDLAGPFQRLALDVIGSAMFSLEMQEHGGEIRAQIRRYAKRLGRPGLLDFLLPSAISSPRDIARRHFRRQWRSFLDRLIDERLSRPKADAERDLFDLLAAASGAGRARPEPGTELADQVATILVAGHETTAAALFWSLYLIAANRGEQERLAAEARSIALDPEHAAAAIPALVRTRAAVDEALRLYPPAFVIVRRAQRADIAAGIDVPPGSLVLVAPWVLHRHRRLWQRPEVFDPSRFAPGAPPPPRFSYLPFGVGPRVCIGSQFALTELVLLVAMLVRAFRIELADSEKVRAVAMVATRPANPPRFRLLPRSAAAGRSRGEHHREPAPLFL